MVAGEVRANTGDIVLNTAYHTANGTANSVADGSGIIQCPSSEL